MRDVFPLRTSFLDAERTAVYSFNEQIDRILFHDDSFYLCSYEHDQSNGMRDGKILRCNRLYQIMAEHRNHGCLDASVMGDLLCTINSDTIDILSPDLKLMRRFVTEDIGLCIHADDHNFVAGFIDGTIRRLYDTKKVSEKPIWAVQNHDKYVIAGGDEQKLIMLDKDLMHIKSLDIGNIIISLYSEGNYILAGTYNNLLYILDSRMDTVLDKCLLIGSPWAIRKSQDKIVISCMQNGIMILEKVNEYREDFHDICNDNIVFNDYAITAHYEIDATIYDCCLQNNVIYFADFYGRKIFRSLL